jgi:hypothetical protein
MPINHPRRCTMNTLKLALLTVLVVTPNTWAFGGGNRTADIRQLNAQLAGRVDDFTCNHGQDNRIDAPSLGQKRDVYVYVPPGYDANKRYPLVYWLHGLNQDEASFLEFAPLFDRAIQSGTLPKVVIVAPDGTINGRAAMKDPPTLYLNSPLGKFEDFVTIDVWNHVVTHYSIHADRKARVLAGASMGAFGAYNLGIKHKSDFGVVAGVLPPLNLRYADCYGRIDTDFNPNCFATLNHYDPNTVVAKFACGLVKIRERQLIAPVFGEGPDVIAKIAVENPAEMIVSHKVKPGELAMFSGYARNDEFNFDAHAESFAFLAKQQGLEVTTVCVPGKHDKQSGLRLFPAFVDFLRPQLEPYAPK